MTKKKSKNGKNNIRKTHTRKKMKGGANAMHPRNLQILTPDDALPANRTNKDPGKSKNSTSIIFYKIDKLIEEILGMVKLKSFFIFQDPKKAFFNNTINKLILELVTQKKFMYLTPHEEQIIIQREIIKKIKSKLEAESELEVKSLKDLKNKNLSTTDFDKLVRDLIDKQSLESDFLNKIKEQIGREYMTEEDFNKKVEELKLDDEDIHQLLITPDTQDWYEYKRNKLKLLLEPFVGENQTVYNIKMEVFNNIFELVSNVKIPQGSKEVALEFNEHLIHKLIEIEDSQEVNDHFYSLFNIVYRKTKKYPQSPVKIFLEIIIEREIDSLLELNMKSKIILLKHLYNFCFNEDFFQMLKNGDFLESVNILLGDSELPLPTTEDKAQNSPEAQYKKYLDKIKELKKYKNTNIITGKIDLNFLELELVSEFNAGLNLIIKTFTNKENLPVLQEYFSEPNLLELRKKTEIINLLLQLEKTDRNLFIENIKLII